MTSPLFELQTERLGPLPLVNHFLARLRMDVLLERHVPTTDRRCALPCAKGLGVLLRSILVEREPVYRQQETVRTFAPGQFGLAADEVDRLDDDRLGRALDRLYAADRRALVTEVVLAATRRFGLRFDQLHNDSTTIRFAGQYRHAKGRSLRGHRAPWITYGHSKDHRPDLKQLLFILTTSADGGVPVQFRCGDGNTNDSTTHIETWEVLRMVAGRSDFLYVADSKLCSREHMLHIDKEGGRLVTVLPRSRQEDEEFRRWIHTHEPQWERVWDRPNPRRKHGPRDRWWVFQYPIPSQEGWPVIWVYSSLLALHQDHRRRERIARAIQDLEDLKRRLGSPRSRPRRAERLERAIEEVLERQDVGRYLKVGRTIREEHRFRQLRRGRPGKNTAYRRDTTRRLDIEWEVLEEVIAYDHKSDGMYPLLTNDRTLAPCAVLEAHKGQPIFCERRFKGLKSVHEIAPVFLHNEGRIEAFFLLYFLALLVDALIERELRAAMRHEGIPELPIYPEERLSKQPTTEQVFRLFAHTERRVLLQGAREVQVFEPTHTDLQREVLRLLGVPASAFRGRP